MAIIQAGIIAICAAVGAVVLAAGSYSVVKLLRLKHKRLPALACEVAERRSSRYSGGHFSFTDADFARTPGTRAKLLHSINSPYSSPRHDWAPITSCDNFPRRAAPPRVSKALVVDEVGHDANAQSPRWPVPPRLKRTNAIPLSTIKPSSSVQLAKRPAKHAEPPPNKTLVPNPVQKSAEEHIEDDADACVAQSQDMLSVEVSPEATTKPKPLFYGNQRSISTGVIVQNPRTAPADSLQATEEPSQTSLMRRLSLPRSSSLFAQQPGQAPSIPMPDLPPDISMKIHKIQSPMKVGIKRPSDINLASEYTSAPDEGASRTFWRTNTGFTSLNIQSPVASGFAPIGLDIDDERGLWEEKTSHFLGAQGPCTQMDSQQSLGESIQHSLPRDNSSGLRFSMYDHSLSRNESSTTLCKDMSPKLNLRAPGSADRRSLGKQALSLGLHPSCSVDIKDHGKSRTQRASTSILKDVTGNEGSPLRWRSRPSSIVTSDLIQFDPDVATQLVKSSSVENGIKKHKHQSSVRLSNFPVVPLGPIFPIMGKELKVTPVDSPIPGLFTQTSVSNQTPSRPPSRATFSHQLDISRSCHSFAGKAENPDPPTMSVMDLYENEDDSSSDCIASTPTRKPSGRNPSIIYLTNNHKSTSLKLESYEPGSTPNLPIFPNLSIPSLPPSRAEPSQTSSHHFSLQFSDLVKPPNPALRQKKPLHGPRTPPRRFRSRARRSTTTQLSTRRSLSRSPVRAGIGKSQCSASPSPQNRKLLSSIMDLRRMNSEVSESGGDKAHRRFRSLGAAHEAIEEGKGEIEERVRIESYVGLIEDIMTPRRMPEVEIPGLLFSARRNEEGVWEAPKWVVGHGDDGLYGEDGFLKA